MTGRGVKAATGFGGVDGVCVCVCVWGGGDTEWCGGWSAVQSSSIAFA